MKRKKPAKRLGPAGSAGGKPSAFTPIKTGDERGTWLTPRPPIKTGDERGTWLAPRPSSGPNRPSFPPKGGGIYAGTVKPTIGKPTPGIPDVNGGPNAGSNRPSFPPKGGGTYAGTNRPTVPSKPTAGKPQINGGPNVQWGGVASRARKTVKDSAPEPAPNNTNRISKTKGSTGRKRRRRALNQLQIRNG